MLTDEQRRSRRRIHVRVDRRANRSGDGIASGFVTVDTIASAEHLEYTAVGPRVNLAARLSSYAGAGQVLIDQRTTGLIGENNASALRPLHAGGVDIWLADDAVSSELLSAVNSLLNREITGNFADFSLREADRGPKKPRYA
jgi:class 3 adenylate cyclase